MIAGLHCIALRVQIELWIGDAIEIQTERVRKQKTDRQDAQLILELMLKDARATPFLAVSR
jgi:hypothetical protein